MNRSFEGNNGTGADYITIKSYHETQSYFNNILRIDCARPVDDDYSIPSAAAVSNQFASGSDKTPLKKGFNPPSPLPEGSHHPQPVGVCTVSRHKTGMGSVNNN